MALGLKKALEAIAQGGVLARGPISDVWYIVVPGEDTREVYSEVARQLIELGRVEEVPSGSAGHKRWASAATCAREREKIAAHASSANNERVRRLQDLCVEVSQQMQRVLSGEAPAIGADGMEITRLLKAVDALDCLASWRRLKERM